jgi:outer membrane immunogenic protein
MRGSICSSVLLAGTCILAATGAWAQTTSTQQRSKVSADMAVTFTAERGQLAGAGMGSFWLKGGGADAAMTLWKCLGIAASVNGNHTANAAPGVDVNQIEFTGGPRCTLPVLTGHSGATDQRRLQLFGQGLFGGVHAFNGVYPSSSGVTPSASSFALSAGGGLNLYFSKHLGVRLLEADYVRTALPNNASNVQNDLRLSFGVTYHIGKR